MRSTGEKLLKSNKALSSSSPLTVAGRQTSFEEHGGSHTSNLPGPTALSCPSEQELRVPCYCEENVWRLAYRRIHVDTSEEGGAAAHIIHCGEQTQDEESERLVSRNYVVFISNEQRCCPMLAQRASKRSKEACFWDYHVIFIQSVRECVKKSAKFDGNLTDNSVPPLRQRTTVFDVDSRLPYACELEAYLEATFSSLKFRTECDRDKYTPLFRVIPADIYLENFYSDRMHMFNSGTGQWNAPPPTYDCIMIHKINPTERNKEGNLSNLAEYVSMKYDHVREDGINDTTKIDETQSVFGEVLTLQLLLSKFGHS